MADQQPKANRKPIRKESSMNDFIKRFKRRNDTSGPHYQNCCVESSTKPKGQDHSLRQSRFLYTQRAKEEALADRHRWEIALNSVGVAPERVIFPRLAHQGRQPVNLVAVDRTPYQKPSRVAVRREAQRRETDTPVELRAYLEADKSEEDMILGSAPPSRQPPASAKSRGKECQAKKYPDVSKDAPKSATETASASAVQTREIEKQVRRWTNPKETVAQALFMLSSETWEKKVAGLNSLRALIQNDGEALQAVLHRICLAVVKEVKNLRSAVSLVAIQTLGDMYVHLKRAMDKEVEWTAHLLLHKAAHGNSFICQAADLALGHMVQHCSPARVMKALLLSGLSHRSVVVRRIMAQHLEVLTDILGPKQLLKGNKELTESFLIAVSELALDSGLEVRSHGRNILLKIIDDARFPKMWEKFVPLKEKESLKLAISKLKSWTHL